MARSLSTEEARLMASKVKNFNGGRKRKAEEDEIKKALATACKLEDALKVFGEKVKAGEQWAVMLYFAYDWGKPQERVDITSNYERIAALDAALVTLANDAEEA